MTLSMTVPINASSSSSSSGASSGGHTAEPPVQVDAPVQPVEVQYGDPPNDEEEIFRSVPDEMAHFAQSVVSVVEKYPLLIGRVPVVVAGKSPAEPRLLVDELIPVPRCALAYHAWRYVFRAQRA
jgi:hypothetical protein